MEGEIFQKPFRISENRKYGRFELFEEEVTGLKKVFLYCGNDI